MGGPLAGLRVVEVASLAPAPFGCMILADLGADVLLVNRAGGAAGLSTPPGVLDRGRRSIALNLKDPAGVAVLKQLVAEADVFVEGFRPGVTERLGLGPADLEAVNPRLIYARMTGWGQDGPFAQRAGHDINYISIAGVLEQIGRASAPPTPPLNLVGDFGGGGLLMVMGILAALHERTNSGRGQVVDAAMVDGAGLLMSMMYGLRAQGLWQDQRASNMFDGSAPFYECYETSDGKFMAVGGVEPQFFAEMLQRLGLADEELPFHLDPTGWVALKERLASVFLTKTRDEWAELFFDSDACVTPVLSPWEAHEHPANAARGSFVEVDGLIQPAPAPRFSRTPAAAPVPLDHGGRDLEAALVGWGIGADEAAKLVANEVVT
ncbi:CaiB/BaiF CoA-transferase family protein [Jatrophihabitans sp.]|uniref:CaiB/BaiF CoA transferase family protein n=1 Tax=Jatrophihabitans sp. TaxID=1932789 RepID=UPI0030C72467|nr:Alpha-methylacyl-CoA racemase [Jatrophihabitans sp.]